MRIAFRVNGGKGIGLGHLIRCLSIANALKQNYKAHIHFICNESPALDLIRAQDFELTSLPPNIFEAEDIALTKQKVEIYDFILVDSYACFSPYLEALRSVTKVAFLDDLQDRKLPVDLVIGNAYAQRLSYQSKILPNTNIIIGPPYIPLRTQFQNLPQKQISPKIKQLLICFGGADPENYTQKTLEFLAEEYDKPIHLDVLLGQSYDHELDEQLLNRFKSLRIHRHLVDPLPLYQSADVVLSAAGSTVWELLAVGTPIIAVPTAANQFGIIKYLLEKGLGLVLSNIEDFKKILKDIQKQEIREQLSQKGKSLVDGKGATRIADTLASLIQITIKQADTHPESHDSKLIWEWRNDITTRSMSRNEDEISWAHHCIWYQQVLSNSSLLVAYREGLPIGMIRMDRQDNSSAEININLNPSFRKQGLGKLVLNSGVLYAFNQMRLKRLTAQIKESNIPSKIIFEQIGFKQIGRHEDFLNYVFEEG